MPGAGKRSTLPTHAATPDVGADMLRAGEFRRLTEARIGAGLVHLVDQVADRRTGRETGRRVRLTALGRNPELRHFARLALKFGRPLHQFHGLARCIGHDLDLAMALDRKSLDRFAGLGDAFDHAASPLRLDSDDDHGGDVRVAAGADQGAEMKLEVLAELQTAVMVGQREAAVDVVGDLFARRVGEVIER